LAYFTTTITIVIANHTR